MPKTLTTDKAQSLSNERWLKRALGAALKCDRSTAQPIWHVEITPPFKAARFLPQTLPNLEELQSEIVAFHLENVLGVQFDLSMANEWSSLPVQIKLRDAELNTASVTSQIGNELQVALAARGNNSWQAALLRGILCNPEAIEYLRHEAIGTTLPPQV